MCVQSKYLLNGVTLPLIGLVAISHLCATHHCSWESCPRFSSTFCSFRFLIYLEFLFICLVGGVFVCLFAFSLFLVCFLRFLCSLEYPKIQYVYQADLGFTEICVNKPLNA